MKEEFLHFVWRHKRFPMHALKTTDAQPIEIIQAGEYNKDGGPDFLNAQIRIGEKVWAGSIEMHTHASDWDAHGHSSDSAYNNVILHVVFENDKAISKPALPVLCLSEYIPQGLIENYEALKASVSWVPCQNYLHVISELTWEIWLERMLVERLELKASEIAGLLKHNKGDWAETAYQWMAKYFGFSVNALPFNMLAERLPLKLLVKHADDTLQLEALLFGVGGMLEDEFTEEYPQSLKKEFHFLKAKYQLNPMERHQWRMLRMRPDNFPCIRIAQFACLMRNSDRFFSKLLALDNLKDIYNFIAIKASIYWDTHYRFEVTSEAVHPKVFGQKSKELFIVNTLIPLVFSYGHIKSQEKYMEKALSLLSQIKPEQNNITRGWEKIGIENSSAWHTQSLLHLKRNYCDGRKCLQCSVGAKIVVRP